jgi:cellulose biosynthesis protein BcsQ
MRRCHARVDSDVSNGLVGEFGREPFQHNAAVVDEYDEIMIDTPPNLGLLTVNALACTDRVPAPPVSMSELGYTVSALRYLRRRIGREYRCRSVSDRIARLAPRRSLALWPTC